MCTYHTLYVSTDQHKTAGEENQRKESPTFPVILGYEMKKYDTYKKWLLKVKKKKKYQETKQKVNTDNSNCGSEVKDTPERIKMWKTHDCLGNEIQG